MHLKILFNYKFYYDHNSDVKSAGRDALEHYFKSGFKENRKFKSDFDIFSIASSFSELGLSPTKKEIVDYIYSSFPSIEFELGDSTTAVFAVESILASQNPSYNDAIFSSLKSFSPPLHSYSFAPSKISRPRINLIVPTIDDAAVYGGIKTAIDFLLWLVENSRDDVDFRIISQNDSNFGVRSMSMLKQYGFTADDPESDLKRSVISGENRDTKYISLRSSELFITTFWATSIALQYGLDRTNVGNVKVCHFLQDFEPNFYAASSSQVLCYSSLMDRRNSIFITNSISLKQFVEAKMEMPADCVAFTPRLRA